MKGNIRLIVSLFIMFSVVNLEGIIDIWTELTIAIVGILIGFWGLLDSLENN